MSSSFVLEKLTIFYLGFNTNYHELTMNGWRGFICLAENAEVFGQAKAWFFSRKTRKFYCILD